jgi:hypothetical protein
MSTGELFSINRFGPHASQSGRKRSDVIMTLSPSAEISILNGAGSHRANEEAILQ